MLIDLFTVGLLIKCLPSLNEFSSPEDFLNIDELLSRKQTTHNTVIFSLKMFKLGWREVSSASYMFWKRNIKRHKLMPHYASVYNRNEIVRNE